MGQSTLTIRVPDIPVEGRPFHLREPFICGTGPRGAFDTRHLGFEPRGPIEGELTLERVGGVVRVKGRVHFPYILPCARSNEPVACEFDEPLDVALCRATGAGAEEDPEEGSSAGDDPDEWSYEGEELDLAPLLYEHIALGLPMKVVAEPLRELPEVVWAEEPPPPGASAEESRESPFAALKGLKIEKGSGR